MNNFIDQIGKSQSISAKVSRGLQRRMQVAQEKFYTSVQASHKQISDLSGKLATPWEIWMNWVRYSTDFVQRSILFWDTMRVRGNNFLEHERSGKPPVLHFDYEVVMDAREFKQPVNYALVRIIPPKGVTVDPKRRPYIIIDPRAGHGPGIGGFKRESEVGVALRAGHPVYFVVFFPEPEPGQTLTDVCAAEAKFVHKVRELHPDSPKPVIEGNCQGGWAAMMLAASHPDETGPIVVNGAPMSYWGGAWSEGEGDNPMRYAGGILGGTWMASLAADLGNGVFDGAYLVQNMENLNPANTLWDKYYHVFENVDTEPPRFLEFERWWGGFYLLNRGEIEWIVRELFVGNKLWAGRTFDLRQIKSPIILFASLGDNITPPQQAFNWVADIYGSTEEIKAGGQVIVGLLHENAGHLGIFVSSKVAKKEYTQIVSVLKSIEALPPGLYGMEIKETTGTGDTASYDVDFVEYSLEDVMDRLNRLKRLDEKPFKAVEALSEFNQRVYELFSQPLVQSFSNELAAQLQQKFHPLRLQKWAISDMNPWLWWLKYASEAVKRQRMPAPPDQPFRMAEKMFSDLVSASLNYYRDVRDALSEAAFFLTYGNLFLLYLAEKEKAPELSGIKEVRQLPAVRDALASVSEGGYPEALARADALLAVTGRPIPLSLCELKEELFEDYKEFLPELTRAELRQIRGEQDIIVRYEPEKAFETMPRLLRHKDDKQRFLRLLERLLSDKRFLTASVTLEQRSMLGRIKEALSAKRKDVEVLGEEVAV